MRLVVLLLAAATLIVPARGRAQPAAVRLDAVDLEVHGPLLEPKDKLLRFLGLSPGQPFGEETQQRLGRDLERLGYRALGTDVERVGEGRIRLHLVVESARVVRNIVIKGNWPLFDDEISRYLSLRSGQRLPADADLRDLLANEAESVRKALFEKGYFEARVTVEPHVALVGFRLQQRAEWIDLLVRVNLGPWYRLGDIDVTYDHADGAQHISKQRLLDLFNHCCVRWGQFTITRMREDAGRAESVLHDAGFPAARVVPEFDFARDADRRAQRVRPHLHVLLKRKVEVRFQGNRALADATLRAALTIFSAGAYDEVELTESVRALQRAYQQRGYFEASVSFRRSRKPAAGPGGDDTEEVVFTVEEGPELKVRSVEIVSDTSAPLTFDAAELKSAAQLETKPFPTLGAIGLGEGGYVTTLQLAQDAERLVDLYKARGFPNAKARSEVAREPAAFDALGAFGAEVTGVGGERNDLYVRFFIDEGRRQLVDHVEFEFVGAHDKQEYDLYKAIALGAGAPFTEPGYKDDQQRLRNVYASSAHPYVQISATGSSWNPAHDRITLRYRVDEGPRVSIGEILIRGNFKTYDFVIRRDLGFRRGDPLDIDKLGAAERNLTSHGIFRDVRVIPVGLNEHRNPVPVLVQVNESYLETVSGTFAIGAATDRLPYYVYGSLGLLAPNFFGLGSQLELKGDFAWVETWGVSARYTDLRLFGPGWRFDVTGFYRKEVTNRFGPITSYGFSSGITHNFTTALSAQLRYDIYLSQINVGLIRLPSSNDNASAQDNTVTARLVLGLYWDRRVGANGQLNPLAPVKGWLLSAGISWADRYLGGDNRFLILSAQAVGILPFRIRNAQFTLLANLRLAAGIPIGEPALPLVERLYGGGDNATRGYDTDTLKSEIVRTQVSPLGGGAGFYVVPEGGNMRLLNTVELQFPIAKTFFGLPFPWVGAIFWDMGAIANTPNNIQGSDFKHSIGITLLRLLTPAGALSFEYAYPITQTLAEERWKTNPWYSHFPGRLHFNWGIPLARF